MEKKNWNIKNIANSEPRKTFSHNKINLYNKAQKRELVHEVGFMTSQKDLLKEFRKKKLALIYKEFNKSYTESRSSSRTHQQNI